MTAPADESGAADHREADEAAERIRAFFERLDRVGGQAFQQTALPLGWSAGRDDDLAAAANLAAVAGLGGLLVDARRQAREQVFHVYDQGNYRPTMVGLNWGLSEGRTSDRVAAVEAVEDAVTAAVVEPYADDGLLARLSSPFELIERGGGVETTFDLGRATASALAPARAGQWTGRAILAVAIVVFVIAAIILGGSIG
jgi:hypothetical protein